MLVLSSTMLGSGWRSNPGVLSRHQEEGQALVLGQGRVGPGEQEDMRGVLGVGGEDLLPVDDPLVAVADRPGLCPGDVRPAVRLGVAEADPGRLPWPPAASARRAAPGPRMPRPPATPARCVPTMLIGASRSLSSVSRILTHTLSSPAPPSSFRHRGHSQPLAPMARYKPSS